MASRLVTNLSRTKFAYRRCGISARSYAIASGPARPYRVTATKPTAKAAPRGAGASTYASSADMDAALGEVNGNGTASSNDSAPSPTVSHTATSIVDPLPTPLDSTLSGLPTDWSRSYHGLGAEPFPKEVSDLLLAPVDPEDVEMKPGKFFAARHTCHYANVVRDNRRFGVFAGNQVPTRIEQGIWTWWLGSCATERDKCRTESRQQGVCFDLSWTIGCGC